MSKVVVGIDPDSDKHGVAIYRDGALDGLYGLRLIDIIELIDSELIDSLEFHIEDVCANNAAFSKSGIKNAKAATNVNRSIGKCQQAQIELERILEHYGVKVVKHKISKQWKDQGGKVIFEKVTGWTGRSNEDTRSAAYMGFQGLNK